MLIPPLTTFEQDGVEIGKKMTSLLIKNIENKTEPIQGPITISGRMLAGGTVADLKSSR